MAPCPDIQHTTIYIADHSFIRLPIGDGVACFIEIHWLHTITYNTCKCHRITCKWSHRITSKISKWIPKFNIVVLQLGLAQRFLKCTSCIICAFCGRDTDTQPNHQVLCTAARHVRVCYGTGKLKTLGLWGSGLNQISGWWFGSVDKTDIIFGMISSIQVIKHRRWKNCFECFCTEKNGKINVNRQPFKSTWQMGG